MAFLLTNTTGGNIVIADLGNRTFATGVTDFNLSNEYNDYEIKNSKSLGVLLDAGDVTGKDTTYEGFPGKSITTASELLLFSLKQSSDDIDEGSINLYVSNSNIQSILGNLTIGDIGDVELNSGLTTDHALVWNGISFENQAIVNSVASKTGDVALDTDDVAEAANLYYTDTRARNSISIAPGSSQYLGYNNTTGELSVSALAITDVTVDSVAVSIGDWVDTTGNYTGDELQEGDVLILTNAIDGTETWIHNGGTAGTVADFTQIQAPQLDDAYIRSLLSGGDGIDYDNTTGEISVDAGTGLDFSGGLLVLADTAVTLGSYGSASEVATFTVDQQGRLTAAGETLIDITASQVSDFDTAAETAIFTNANFVDGTTIDFTVTSGESVTAEVSDGSIDESKLSIATPSTGTLGQPLVSDGAGGFEWGEPVQPKKSWSWGAASTANNNTNRYIDQFDGVSTNIAPYVTFFPCELRAISFSTNVASTWTAEIHKNGVQVATLDSDGLQFGKVAGLSIAFDGGDRVGFYVNGSAVNTPAINALFEEV